jgi:hypothetical protein
MNPYKKLSAIDVSEWTETKGNMKLAYLSWPFAVDLLMNEDPGAYWEFHDPKVYNDTMMVSCTVTAFGKSISMHLPVMDHTNKAIKNPDAFMINKNMMRCLVKAIACHGLGLKLYAGEDLPSDPKPEAKPEAKPKTQSGPSEEQIADWIGFMEKAPTLPDLQAIFSDAYRLTTDEATKLTLKTVYDGRKAKFLEAA